MAKSVKAATPSKATPSKEDGGAYDERRVPTEEEVRRRAHEIWLAEGMPEAREVDNWMRARRELEREAGLD